MPAVCPGEVDGDGAGAPASTGSDTDIALSGNAGWTMLPGTGAVEPAI